MSLGIATSDCFSAVGLIEAPLEPEDVWGLVKARLVNVYGEAVFRSWFRPVSLLSYEEGFILLGSPTDFHRDWLRSNYMDFIHKTWRGYQPRIASVDICTKTKEEMLASQQSTEQVKTSAELAPQESEPVKDMMSLQDVKDYERRLRYFDERLTFENFVVGKSNELAHCACKKIAELASPAVGNNPLFLYGGVGLGKTHLMHAIANHKIAEIKREFPNPLEWMEKAAAKIIYLPSEKFVQEFVTALSSKGMPSFKDKFRSVDILMIDDIQFFSGKDYTQEEFFHTFNSLMDDGKQLVISADRTPGNLSGIEERIRSRMGGGLVADITSAPYELRVRVLQRKAEMLEVHTSDNVLNYLAEHVQTNIRELVGALHKIAALAKLNNQEISMDLAKVALFDMIRPERRIAVSISDIQGEVAEFYHLKADDLFSKNRSRHFSRPRQLAMFLCKKLTKASLVDIARNFGAKDHTTVIHAINKIEALSNLDPQFSRYLQEITLKLRYGTTEL